MRPQRRTYSKSFKAQVIQECSEPGASIANIALGYSLNANLDHKWIRLPTHKTTATVHLPFRQDTNLISSSHEALVLYKYTFLVLLQAGTVETPITHLNRTGSQK
ncbi:transposase, partial [Yersinia enterocolitica]